MGGIAGLFEDMFESKSRPYHEQNVAMVRLGSRASLELTVAHVRFGVRASLGGILLVPSGAMNLMMGHSYRRLGEALHW